MTWSNVIQLIREQARSFVINDVYSYAGALIKPSSVIRLISTINLRNLHRQRLQLVTVGLPYIVGRQAQ